MEGIPPTVGMTAGLKAGGVSDVNVHSSHGGDTSLCRYDSECQAG